EGAWDQSAGESRGLRKLCCDFDESLEGPPRAPSFSVFGKKEGGGSSPVGEVRRGHGVNARGKVAACEGLAATLTSPCAAWSPPGRDDSTGYARGRAGSRLARGRSGTAAGPRDRPFPRRRSLDEGAWD